MIDIVKRHFDALSNIHFTRNFVTLFSMIDIVKRHFDALSNIHLQAMALVDRRSCGGKTRNIFSLRSMSHKVLPI